MTRFWFIVVVGGAELLAILAVFAVLIGWAVAGDAMLAVA